MGTNQWEHQRGELSGKSLRRIHFPSLGIQGHIYTYIHKYSARWVYKFVRRKHITMMVSALVLPPVFYILEPESSFKIEIWLYLPTPSSTFSCTTFHCLKCYQWLSIVFTLKIRILMNGSVFPLSQAHWPFSDFQDHQASLIHRAIPHAIPVVWKDSSLFIQVNPTLFRSWPAIAFRKFSSTFWPSQSF